MSVCGRNIGAKRRTKFGLALEESAKQILAHVRGETKLPTRRIVLADEVGVCFIPRDRAAEVLQRVRRIAV